MPADRDAVAKARLQVETRKWVASARNPIFGERPDVQVNVVNAGELHLAALRHRIVESSRPLAGTLPTAEPKPLELPKPWPASELAPEDNAA